MTHTRYLIRQESDGTYAVAKENTWNVTVLADSLSFDEAVEFLTSLGATNATAKVLESRHGVAAVYVYSEVPA